MDDMYENEYWYARDDRDIEMMKLNKQILSIKLENARLEEDYWKIKIQQLKEGSE